VAGPTPDSILRSLTQARLIELSRELGVAIPATGRKDTQIARLIESAHLPLPAWLGYLVRDELRAACREHGLDASSRTRTELAGALLDAAGLPRGRDTIPPIFDEPANRDLPRRGDIVVVRHRQYLVDAVHPGAGHDATRVALVGLDDDNQGKRTEVLWELELGARVLDQRNELLGDVEKLDPPRTFGAYYNALRWNRVTATDAKLFQAPFRAGVKLMRHQLTPLKRALDLPRANLFIADDVGLGKTIEAGLVLQELLLRNQIELVLIIAPASVCPQWQREMARRFGLQFEIYNRAFVQRRRQDRGFGVNPWCTHARFIISYQTLRRPEYEGPLHAMLKESDRRTLLILDEAHTAAPASSSRYAVFSETTNVIQRLAPLFDHRLFLSATPHNGHSNSFSTLLSLLDRQRFTRGVKADARALDQIMVRRLKSDLRALDEAHEFPEREVIALSLTTRDAPEIELARLLAEYTSLTRPETGRERLVFVNLQKRLLSGVAAFCRTLEAHARSLGGAADQAEAPEINDDDDLDDELRDTAEVAADAARARNLAVGADGRALVERMLQLSRRHREASDAKVDALLAWIRTNMCAAAGLPDAKRKDLGWQDKRLIVFTEYGDTKNYLLDQLNRALGHTEQGADRVMTFHGGMSDAQRDLVQRAFNGSPSEHPVRILVATDAAREGLNLQAHCADLFHFDIPWNPARMEQRNGRIDRALQPARIVRCHYFLYDHRPEDGVLSTLVDKIAIIQRELGSLATVVLEDVERVLAQGIDQSSIAALDGVTPDAVRVAVVTDELEQQRDRTRIQRDLAENQRLIDSSKKVIDFDEELLRETLDVGFTLAGSAALEPLDEGRWKLPALPESWQRTLDTVRPPRERDEEIWDWRERAPLPIVFTAPEVMTEDVAHLHLSHPVTQRVLSRFQAQGFSARDLSRVTAMRADVPKPAVLALGRLSLFGPGAARLHDALIAVGALWDEEKRGAKLRALPDKDSDVLRQALERCLHERAPHELSKAIVDTLIEDAAADFGALWPALQEEADAEQDRATKMLTARAHAESEAMRVLLVNQDRAIRDARREIPLGLEGRERAAYEADTRAMQARLAEIAEERDREPKRIEAVYEVALRRVSPVGLVYLWPAKEKRR
jgi:superfamily II DNA or RNA helicase